MDESKGKNSDKHKDKARSNKPGNKNVHNAHARGKPISSSKHPAGQYHKKRPHSPGENGQKKRVSTTPSHPPPSSSSSSRRVDDMRLVLDSTPSDEELAKKVHDVRIELEAVDRALADEGTYLGIVDKVSNYTPDALEY